MKQTRTLTFDKIYDPAEKRCHFVVQGNAGPEDTTPDEIAEQIRGYLESMKEVDSNAKITVSFREEV
jgi:hypothetical protein